MKNIQIPEQLFFLLIQYHICGTTDFEEEIITGI